MLACLGLRSDASDSLILTRLAFYAPYRHLGGRDAGVQRMSAAVGRVMAAAAHVVKTYSRRVYEVRCVVGARTGSTRGGASTHLSVTGHAAR